MRGAQLVTGAESCVLSRTLRLLLLRTLTVPLGICVSHACHTTPFKTQPGVGPTSKSMALAGIWPQQALPQGPCHQISHHAVSAPDVIQRLKEA